jgi:hypothetical protein
MRFKADMAWPRTCVNASLLVILLGLTFPAGAGPPVFSFHDTNQDGYLDRAEYAALLSRIWDRRARRSSRRPLPRPMAFEAIDTNSDGRISREELLHSLEQRLMHRRWRHVWGG